MNNENDNEEVETTAEEEPEIEETDLVEEEEKTSDKLKKLRNKLAQAEEDKKKILDDLQREKADFLNAKRRLEEERAKDAIRHKKDHVEKLLPLCDSFQMAMSDKEAWEAAPESWRKGVEGIHGQLNSILNAYGVKAIDPTGEDFDPNRHEAVGTEEVESNEMVDKVTSVIQKGYEMEIDGNTEIIRHARVTTGIKKD